MLGQGVSTVLVAGKVTDGDKHRWFPGGATFVFVAVKTMYENGKRS